MRIRKSCRNSSFLRRASKVLSIGILSLILNDYLVITKIIAEGRTGDTLVNIVELGLTAGSYQFVANGILIGLVTLVLMQMAASTGKLKKRDLALEIIFGGTYTIFITFSCILTSNLGSNYGPPSIALIGLIGLVLINRNINIKTNNLSLIHI